MVWGIHPFISNAFEVYRRYYLDGHRTAPNLHRETQKRRKTDKETPPISSDELLKQAEASSKSTTVVLDARSVKRLASIFDRKVKNLFTLEINVLNSLKKT